MVYPYVGVPTRITENSEIYFNKWYTINCDVIKCSSSTCGWQVKIEASLKKSYNSKLDVI